MTTSPTIHRALLKAKYSLYSALVFFLFANPETVRLLQQVLGGWMTMTSSSGFLTMEGVFLTTALFFFTMWGLMLLPSES
jgi:hypothetical protein